LGLQYDGTGFAGWQAQANRNTLQDVLESALGIIAAEPVRTVCAGRTDAGVHALGQVVHFDTISSRPNNAWVRGVNSRLPDSIAVQWATPVSEEFHARFSAVERNYCYILQVSAVRSAILAAKVGWIHSPLNVERMREAAALLVGHHDFSAFRSSECQARTPLRELREISIDRRGHYLIFRFRADAFLHHMVRNIVGSLVAVGKGRHAPDWVGSVLQSRDRTAAAPTFAPDGLYLASVSYAQRWSLPEFQPSLIESITGS
jgi:tRNA pseudouridine38-40 synthase